MSVTKLKSMLGWSCRRSARQIGEIYYARCIQTAAFRTDRANPQTESAWQWGSFGQQTDAYTYTQMHPHTKTSTHGSFLPREYTESEQKLWDKDRHLHNSRQAQNSAPNAYLVCPRVASARWRCSIINRFS